MKKILFLSLFLLTSIFAFAQPSNDNCSTAQNLGTLPTPVACPNGVGSNVNVSGTNINATAPNPYTTLLGCQTTGNQPGPALDVWYRFVASGNQANINITPGAAPFLANPAITLWSGSCGNLTGFNCDNNGTATGNNTATFQPLTPGQTYYIQVSGMNSTAAGNFNMSVNASNDCNNCLQVANLTANPAPINGTYQPGQTVTFCFTISQYNQVSANWLHGVIPTFGNGWNVTSLTVVPAASCSGSGTWTWYTSNTSSATNLTTGPGFYYNYPGGGAGNNYGDNNSLNTCTWTFCWTLQTKPNCGTGTNLNISINTTADGETGSWTSPACGGDPNYNFAAVLNCCSTTVVGTPPTCFNGTNGSATATPTGIAPYTYSWNTVPVQTTQTATNLSPGNYTVTVTDNANCVSTATVNIANPTQIQAPITSTNVTCNGLNNGQATVNPSGGVAPYTYSWNTVPVQTTQTATNLSPGTYTVTVTANNGCIRTNTVTITQPPALTATTSVVASTCGQPNGSATATVLTGTGPFTYSWNTSPIQTTQTATNLLPGNYTVTITGLNNCTTTAVASINTTGSVTAQTTFTNVSCFGGSNGSATATGSGGSSTYTYSWNTVPAQTTQTATNLSAGSYIVTVTSAGCSATATVSITQPTQITSTITSTVSTCGLANGSASVSPNGGVGPYTYLWSNNQTTQTITGLLPGTYSVTITGTGGCTSTNSVTITSPATPVVSIPQFTNVSCNGGNNGSANSTVVSGVSPYTYLWSNNQTTQNATNLVAGNYTVTVTDANLCQSTATVTISQPTQLLSAITTTNVSCSGGNNGQASTSPSGGVGPYTYSWNTVPVQTTQTATSLSAGTYTVTITDANNCQAFASANITQPTPVTSGLISSTNPSCNGGTNGQITVSASGGIGPVYFYSLNGGPVQTNPQFTNLSSGSYTITVSDANNCQSQIVVNLNQPSAISATSSITNPLCFGGANGQILITPTGGTAPYTFNWSNNTTSNPIIGIGFGNYAVTVTDANNCQFTLNNLLVTQPTQLTINLQSTSPICIGGQSNISSNPNGGTTPYSFNWSNSQTTQNISVNPITTTNYSVTVTDANNCQVSGNTTVVVYPPLLVTSTSSPSTICLGQSTTLNAFGSGGNGSAYVYTWNPGNIVGQSVSVNPQTTTIYTVTISDGCSPSTTSTITVNVSPTPQVSFTTTPLSGCEPLTVTFTNTTPGSNNCVWTINGNNYNNCVVTQTFSSSGSFNSQLQVTNSSGCTGQSQIVTANVYPMPVANFSPNPQVTNIYNPTISFANTSSTGTYAWNFGDGNTSIATYPTHTYTDTGTYVVQLIVTTQYGCSDTVFGTVHIDEVFSVYIPNAFTPNGDGKNESFYPVVMGAYSSTFYVFDRWGEMIYQTDKNQPWDGTYKGEICKQDVYVYKLIVVSEDRKKYEYVGKVSLIR